jgi:hypothetical protein
MKHHKRTSSTPFVRVGPSGVHGLGAFATRDLPAEAFLGLYEGRRYTKAEIATKVWDDQLTYLFTLTNQETIDGAKGGNATRHLNHSCEPNCEAVEEYDESGELVLRFQTLMEVDAGDELFIDYSLTADDGSPPSKYPAIAARRAAAERCWRRPTPWRRKPDRPRPDAPAGPSARFGAQRAQLRFRLLELRAQHADVLLQPFDARFAALRHGRQLALRLQRAQCIGQLAAAQHLAPGAGQVHVALEQGLLRLAVLPLQRRRGQCAWRGWPRLCEGRRGQGQRKGQEAGFQKHAARYPNFPAPKPYSPRAAPAMHFVSGHPSAHARAGGLKQRWGPRLRPTNPA